MFILLYSGTIHTKKGVNFRIANRISDNSHYGATRSRFLTV